MPILRFFSTNGRWEDYKLGETTRIGRHPEQDLQLLDRMVSKEHAIVLNKNNAFILKDLNSRNGTSVNDILIEDACVLEFGDEIGIGNHVLRFLESPTDVYHSSVHAPRIQRDYFQEDEDRTEAHPCLEGFDSSRPALRQPMLDHSFLPESEVGSDAALRQDYEKLRIAMELSAEAASTCDLDQLLEIIIDKAFQVFRADRVAILLKNEEGHMRTRIAVDRKHRVIKNFRISETLLDVVLSEKAAVLSGDILKDERFSSSKSLVVDNVRSTMCVPLLNETEILGVINLDTQLMTGAFEAKDLQILTGFARQAALFLQQARMIESQQRIGIVRDNLQRLFSPHLVNEVMSGNVVLQKGGRRTVSTVLFADMRGFTRMSEENEPEEVVATLNAFFERMVHCVFEANGAVDKFVGDEVMAVWGVNLNFKDHQIKAVRCALAMLEAVESLNIEREQEGKPPIQVGIGVATGLMVAGYMGSSQAMSYTVIGDTVNLGSRLCATARAGELLINEATYEAVADQVQSCPLPPILLKGKKEPVNVYRVLRP